MSATLTVLASGSSANGYIIQADNEVLILEAGVPFKECAKALAHDISKVKAVICSHGHKDHSAYIKQYQQHGLTVYSNADVASDFDGVKELEPMRKYHFGGFTVVPLSAYHNVDCLSFIIDHESFGRIVFITDSYQWPYKVSNVTYWMIEANYDKDIVIEAKCDGIDIRSQSQYHMAIDETLNTLKRNRSSSTMGIFLIHLSDALSDAKGFERLVHNEIGIEAHSVGMGDIFGLKACDF